MPTRWNALLLVIAVVALAYTGFKTLNSKPQPHPVNDAACTPEAIKAIGNVTERAVHAARCAKRGK